MGISISCGSPRTDMSVAIPAVGQSDEIGRMAHAVEVFKESIIKAATAAGCEAAEHMARRHARHRSSA